MRPRETKSGTASCDSDDVIRYLRNNKFFRSIDDDVLSACYHLFSIVPYPKQTRLYDVADEPFNVYFLKAGRVGLNVTNEDGREFTVALLGPGDVFGQEALFGRNERRTTATCLEDCVVCTSRADQLFPMIAKHPSLLMNVARYLNEQGEEVLTAVEEFAFLTVIERIVKALERLALEHGVPHRLGTRIGLKLTHLDIATLVGSTRETVTIQVNKLQHEGRLVIEGRNFILPQTTAPA